ncbi:hypothetical protein VKT23_015638 [Stygiomarasmius scandens]|uniref:F-box domain-containing protein n=1 Tax=Marasmiellus scandens TaxID=2682957 RepID=A0ABR1J019_9AGAR
MSTESPTDMSILKGDSHFTHLLKTNYSASAEESRLIRGMLKESKQVVDDIDKEIAALRASIKKRLVRRNYIAAKMDAHRALISPIRRLSSELISEIFIHCLSDDHNPVRSIKEAPLLLTRICRLWREIALADPRLWKSLHIHIPYHYNDEGVEKILNQRSLGMSSWLSRSGSLPISLSFSATYNDYPGHRSSNSSSRPTEPRAYGDFMRAMLQPEFSSRWRYLDLKLTSSILETWLPLKGQGLSSLHTLKLDFGDDLCWSMSSGERPHDFSLSDLLQEAPNLRVFSLCNYVHNPYHLPIRWEKLTDLTLKSFCYSPEGLTLQQALSILAKASDSLQAGSFHVSLPIPHVNVHEDQDIVTLPSLRSLEVKFAVYTNQQVSTRISEKEVGNLFQYLNTPSLTDLSVQVTCGHPNVMNIMTLMPFHSLLERSSCSLRSLNVELPITSNALTECLHLTPQLSTLSLTECRWNRMPMLGIQLDLGPMATFTHTDNEGPVICDELLRVLTPETSSEPTTTLCPRLEKLRLAKCGPISGEAIINLATSRWNIRGNGERAVRKRLRVLDVALFVTKNEDIKSVKKVVPQVQALKQQGMRFSLSYPQEKQRTGRDSPWAGLPSSDPRRARLSFDRLF